MESKDIFCLWVLAHTLLTQLMLITADNINIPSEDNARQEVIFGKHLRRMLRRDVIPEGQHATTGQQGRLESEGLSEDQATAGKQPKMLPQEELPGQQQALSQQATMLDEYTQTQFGPEFRERLLSALLVRLISVSESNTSSSPAAFNGDNLLKNMPPQPGNHYAVNNTNTNSHARADRDARRENQRSVTTRTRPETPQIIAHASSARLPLWPPGERRGRGRGGHCAGRRVCVGATWEPSIAKDNAVIGDNPARLFMSKYQPAAVVTSGMHSPRHPAERPLTRHSESESDSPHGAPTPTGRHAKRGWVKSNYGNQNGAGHGRLVASNSNSNSNSNSKGRFYSHSKLLTPHGQRFIFGRDDRRRVNSATTRKYPYNNVVRMSTGCTGTLVSPMHVLTAAHCLHSGYSFKARASSLKIYVPHSMGTKVYYGRSIKVSRMWHKLSTLSDLRRAMFDYGILELHSPVPGRRRFTGFDWRSDTFQRPISFIAYPTDHPGMLRSTCVVDFRAGTLLLNRCDSASGSSGSAALMYVKRKLSIVGVVSAVINNVLPARDFNAITRLTMPKVWEICDMIGRGMDRFMCSDGMLRRRPVRPRRYMYQHG